MRQEFAQAMVALHAKENQHIFLTGDLGFMALEKVQEVYRERFVNAGIAEQNMISVAAGLAASGFIPWVYSIAPFALLRPYEQIRNDVCLHALPVKIIGNGGGYGYGIMGATHHVLEDIGVMRILPHMKLYFPLLNSDVADAVSFMAEDPAPNYLRLNLGAKLPATVESFRPWRKIKEGKKIIIIGVGPVLGNVFEMKKEDVFEACEIWAVGELPILDFPDTFIQSLNKKRKIIVIEEHRRQGGFSEYLASLLMVKLDFPVAFEVICAEGYPSGKYGSQRWHQEENALAGEPLLKKIEEFLHG